jgi:hypothetical protein
VSLRDLAAALAIVPGIAVIDLKESPTAPPLLVVDIPEDLAERLRLAFKGRLTIESDAPLQPFVVEMAAVVAMVPETGLVPRSTAQSSAQKPHDAPPHPTV